MKPNHILILSISISLAILSLSVSFVYASFQDNTSTPPNDNVSAPINTGGGLQVKEGPFRSNSEIQGTVFRSTQNAGYYVHPNGSSRLNNILADNVHSYGTMNAHDVLIRNTGGAPRWVSTFRNADWASAGWYQYRVGGGTAGPWCKFLNTYTGGCSCPGGSYIVANHPDSNHNQWHMTVYCRFN